jgi:hypothetical protein
MDTQRLNKIREYFIKIKKAHDWAEKNADNRQADYQTLLDRLEVVYNELELLGVSKTFSAALFIFNPNMEAYLVEQFKMTY